MKTAAYIITVIGLVIFGYSLFLEPYTDEQEFNAKYMEITGEDRSEQFFELRDEYLTIKYSLADYGLTITFIGLIAIFVFYKGWSNFKTVNSKGLIIGLGILATLTTTIFYVADLFNEMARGSAPYWADSLGIPLMSVPPMLILLLIWGALNSIGLRGDFKTGVPVSSLSFRQINYWYLIISILTSIILILVIIDGYFWMVVPGFLWLYFYISLLLGRQVSKLEKVEIQENNL